MDRFDVVVIGAGHAGIEAAHASARLGLATACITLRLDRIGHLPCNCSIGGPAKGHIAREVDALGGLMGVATDHTMTHLRRVGTGKGPAVQTVRAQVCKASYPRYMRQALASIPGLTLIEGQVLSIESQEGRVSGVVAEVGGEAVLIPCRAAVITTGTFLNGLCHEGSKKSVAARDGDQAVQGLSGFLLDLDVKIRRFKTGTTPRVRLSSLNLDSTLEMPSEWEAGPLSYLHDRPFPLGELLPTWQTHTNAETHRVLTENLGQSAMFSGQIEGVGPRYCPSVEDKVFRFAGKDAHPIFLEVEEWGGESVYVQGFSTSMPAQVQIEALRTIRGLEKVEMLKPGYAVEYDMADPTQLDPHLMSKLLPGLFLAGQINGTSGYEEAAGQGIAAGINAARFAAGEEPVPFLRSESFIGVMIDDLVTKGVQDPYRMLTARAEHRLVLRHDNADRRLTPLAMELGLACETRRERFESKIAVIDAGSRVLDATYLTNAHNPLLDRRGIAPVKGRSSLSGLLKRPHVDLDLVEEIAVEAGVLAPGALPSAGEPGSVGSGAREQIEVEAVYGGYLKRQVDEVEQARKLEQMPIPTELNYEGLKGLSYESREKLGRVRPTTVGQAGRVPGVRPTDIALLIGHLRAGK